MSAKIAMARVVDDTSSRKSNSGRVEKILVQNADKEPETNGNYTFQNHIVPVNDNNAVQNENTNVFDKISLVWENIDVHLPPQESCTCLPWVKKSQPKQLLRGAKFVFEVSGIAKPGELLAIMGASGAGKTTLLNVLNFRSRGDLEVNGNVKINGETVKSTRSISAISGYVQQDEAFIGTLTVREHLIFQAMVRMDKSLSDKERYERVDEILAKLNLKKCERSQIGTPEKGIKGISGGERRRLAFGSEILTNPGLLFCDEPTSGLDSFMAQSVVESMKFLAQEGKTIVCTIHQPSSEIYEMFDKLCLLAEGRLAYMGPLNNCISFFQSVSFSCPANYNPADFYIKTLAVTEANREQSLDVVNKICDTFEKSEVKQVLDSDISKANAEFRNDTLSIRSNNVDLYKANTLRQLKWLTWRSAKSVVRDVVGTQIRITQTVFIAIVLGLIFLRIKYNQAGIMNINGVLFLLIANTSFGNMFAIINTFPDEITIFLREHKNAMYRVINYYVSRSLIDLPFFIILPFISTTIIYWMTNLNPDVERYLLCCAYMILVTNVAVSFGLFISSAAPSTTAALALSSPILVPLMIFSGIFLNLDTVPDYFIWLRYLSWFSYTYELLVINQWSGYTNIPCDSLNTTRCITNGDDVITMLAFKESNVGQDIGALFALFIGWRVITFLILLLKSYRR